MRDEHGLSKDELEDARQTQCLVAAYCTHRRGRRDEPGKIAGPVGSTGMTTSGLSPIPSSAFTIVSATGFNLQSSWTTAPARTSPSSCSDGNGGR